jgi:hypothetical protein
MRQATFDAGGYVKMRPPYRDLILLALIFAGIAWDCIVHQGIFI